MHALVAVLALMVLAGCSDAGTVGVSTATARPAESPGVQLPSSTPTATEAATPSPTPEARAPEIVAFNVLVSDFAKKLMIRIHNPNEGIGLIRTGFELTAVAADGAIIDVYGDEGLPGAPCCTIYRLPPGGDFGLAIDMDTSSVDPATLELAITGRWVDWSTVEPPQSEVSNATAVPTQFSGPQLTGRVTTPAAVDEGPFNVWVVAFVDSPAGMIIISGGVDCVGTADARAFALDTYLGSQVQGPFTVDHVVAYTTTVPGVTEPAPGC
jgi:hypothetical protein